MSPGRCRRTRYVFALGGSGFNTDSTVCIECKRQKPPGRGARSTRAPHVGRNMRFRRTFTACRAGCTENAVVPRITFCSADWKCCISSCVPTVMRTQVGMMGQMRPMKTFCSAIASITSLPGRLGTEKEALRLWGNIAVPIAVEPLKRLLADGGVDTLAFGDQAGILEAG